MNTKDTAIHSARIPWMPRQLLITSCKLRLQASLLWFPDIARSVVMGPTCKWFIAKSNHETDEENRNAATDQ